MTAQDRLSFTLGLAQKAGKLVSGDTAVRICVKAGKARLLLLAADVSEGSQKQLMNMADNHSVPVLISSLDNGELGRVIGKGQRTAVAVSDRGFSEMISKNCSQNSDSPGGG
jgi:ribosomal protein L7Ae-like RNA K-turn-binding protein